MTILDFRGRDWYEENEQKWLLRAVHLWIQDKQVQKRLFRYKVMDPRALVELGVNIEGVLKRGHKFGGEAAKVWHRKVRDIVGNREVRRAIQRTILAIQVRQFLEAKEDPSQELFAPQKKADIMRELLELHQSMSEKVEADERLICLPGEAIS